MSQKNNDHVKFTVDSATVIRVLALLAGFLLVLTFVKTIVHPLTLILVSAFLALALNPAVSWIASKLRSKSRVKATGMAYLLVIVFLVSFIALVVPPLVRQTVDFVKEVPQSIQDVKDDDSAFSNFIYRYDLNEEVDRFTDDFGDRFKDLGEPALNTAGAIGSAVVSIITVFVLTFMMLVEGPMWLKRLWVVQPPAKRKHRQELGQKMYRVVTGYVNGQVIIAALGGTFAAITLFIMSKVFDAPINAVALGGIIAMFALLPLVGTIIGSIIVVLACLFVSAPLALAAAIYFVIYQQIENVTIQPYIQSKSNNLTPLIVFLAALLGVGLGGFLGAFLAIPAAGCIKILVDDHFASRLPKNADNSDIR
jgi:predicted PurR-regulated permease PerM